MKKVLLFLLAVALYGCGDEEQIANTRNEVEPIELDGKQVDINSNLQVFSWEFFSQVCRDKRAGDNVIVSPISLGINLGMLLNGLSGNSKQELLEVMHLQGHDTNDINQFFQKMMKGIQRADKQTTFSSANSFGLMRNTVCRKTSALLSKTAMVLKSEVLILPTARPRVR